MNEIYEFKRESDGYVWWVAGQTVTIQEVQNWFFANVDVSDEENFQIRKLTPNWYATPYINRLDSIPMAVADNIRKIGGNWTSGGPRGVDTNSSLSIVLEVPA